MEHIIKPINQILVYTSLKYVNGEVRKNLSLSMTNVCGYIDEVDGLYLYTKDKEYIGVIDLKCPSTQTSLLWGDEE